MSELASPHVTANHIADPDITNGQFRRLPRQLAELLRGLLHTDATPDEDYGYVVRGLSPSGSGLVTTISAGVAVAYDSSVDPDTTGYSKYAVLVSEEDLEITHDAHDPSDPRVDVVCLQWSSAVADVLAVPKVGASPANVATIRRAVCGLWIQKGTPGAGAPTYPTGMVVLCEADIPAGSGAISYRGSVAQRANTGYVRRDPLVFEQDDAYAAGNTTPPLMAMRKVGRGLDGVGLTSFLSWDWGTDWPVVTRGVSDTGEVSSPTKMWPLMAPGGRTWWRTYPFAVGWEAPEFGSKFVAATGLVDVVALHSYLRIQHSAAGSGYILPTVAMPIEQRGLRVVGARLRYQVDTEFDGTVDTFEWTLYHVDGQTVATAIGSVAMVNTAGSEVTAEISPFTPVLMGPGSSLAARVELNRSADGTQGQFAVLSVEVQFEEGHD